LRQVSIEDLKDACAAAGTLPVTHASYFEMKSSHSGTPILSPLVLAVEVFAAAVLDAAVFVAALLVFAVFAVLVVAVLSAAPPQAIRSMPVTIHKAISKVSLVVICQFSLLQEMKYEVVEIRARARR
jgi:uncharacterized protein (DUF58 family)